MQVSTKVSEYLQKHKLNTVWRRFLYGAASVVVFVTTYMLILPAITVENATDNFYSVVNSVSGNSVSGNSVSGNSVSMGDLPVGIEKPEDWELITGNVELTGESAVDLVAVAKSQLGYKENQNYYYIDKDGILRGYTRYGEWYGEAYREWSGIFASFCLHYAQVSEAEVPQAADCNEWIRLLSEEGCGRYRTVSEYLPYSGDLLFLDMNQDQIADSVAIIDEVVADDTGMASEVKVIQGDLEDRVQYVTYSLQDARIVGYGQISKPGAFFEKSYTDGKLIITARYTKDAQIPLEAELQAYQVTEETAPDRYEQRQQDMQTILQEMQGADSASAVDEEQQEEYLIYNIGFYLDGQEIEPADKVNVTIQFLSEEGLTVGEPIAIVHFAESGTETLTGMEVLQGENGELSTSFDTTGFSDYGIMPLALEPDGIWYVSTPEEFRDAIKDTDFNGVIKISNALHYNTWHENLGTLTLGNGRNVTIDLNGQKIGTDGYLVVVNAGAQLTITDSQATPERPKVPVDNAKQYDTNYNADNYTLTYYVTETEVVNANDGETSETVYEHVVTGQGVVTGYGEVAVFDVTGGTLTIESGMIANSNNRAIRAVNGATVNLYGGYLCGNNKLAANYDVNNGIDGGAIYAADSQTKIDFSGTVIAANKARYGGGIHMTNGGSITIRDNAVLAGNTVTGRGGGIDVWECTIDMTGGYVTNNVSTLGVGVENADYYSGGGGVVLRGDGVVFPEFVLSGGYITGNKAFSGAGVYLGEGAGGTMIMTGGYVTANYASDGEGGGIRIDHSNIGRISGGYITNNTTATKEHWGGGGLFIADSATCQVLSVLVTDNEAGGFGGGVAGCSTGRIYSSAIQNDTKGAAIYENSAAGTNLSGSASIKQQDHIFALSNEAFMKDEGYQDYFCMLYSHITDEMLGDGSQNWSGSIDGVNVTIPEGEAMVGNSVVGLTANPSAEDIAAAQKAADEQNGVYINGNSSYTHGGGILCNGYMVLGALEADDGTEVFDEITFGTRLEPAGVKDYVSADGTPIEMKGGEFTFILTDAVTEEVVAKVTNDNTGTLLFDRRIVFDEELGLALNETKTYQYILQELDAGAGIVTDETKYLIEATVQYISEEDWIEILQEDGTIDEYAIEKFIYHLLGVNVYKLADDYESTGNRTQILAVTENEMRYIEESQAIVIDLRNEDTYATFVNYAMEDVNLTVTKEWAEGVTDREKKPVTVVLEQNGEAYTEKGDYKVTLGLGVGETTADPGDVETTAWSYTWTGLPVTVTTDGTTTYNTYSVKEQTLEGYLAEYKYSSDAVSAAYWVPVDENEAMEAGNQYMIVNNAGNRALNVTAGHSYDGFDENDSMTIQRVTNADILRQLGREGQMIYNASSIPDTATFIAQAYKGKVVLKNTGYHNSWLQIYSVYDWGGTPGKIVSDASFFEYNNGILQGRVGSAVDGELRDVTYGPLLWNNNGTEQDGEIMFTISRDATASNAARLYKLVRTVSGGATTVTITNTPIEEAEFTLEITKVEEGDNSVLLEGAEFEIYATDGIPLRFVLQPNGDYKLYDANEDIGTPVNRVVSDKNGEIKVIGMKAGTYTIQETRAPAGYFLADPIAFTLNEDTPNGQWIRTIEDRAMEYELPVTGGEGTFKYTVAGLLLILSAVYLLYKKEKRRREGVRSP